MVADVPVVVRHAKSVPIMVNYGSGFRYVKHSTFAHDRVDLDPNIAKLAQ